MSSGGNEIELRIQRDKELALPSSFQASLVSIYAGTIIGRNHAADELRKVAEATFSPAYNALKVKSLDGQRVWRSHDSYNGSLGVQEVVYSTMIERPRLKTLDHELGRQAIRLVINDEWNSPAAIIALPLNAESSAALIVGSEINNEQHIAEVSEILRSFKNPYLR